MGTSATLLKKEFLELSLEIDTDIQIEISTGFGSRSRPTCHASIPVTVEELENIIKELTSLYESLKKLWVCANCGSLNEEQRTECNTCEEPQKIPNQFN